MKALVVTAVVLGLLATPGFAAAAEFESFTGELTAATLSRSKLSITVSGSVTPVRCGSELSPEMCGYAYRVLARPDVPFYRCNPGAWEPDGDDSEAQELVRSGEIWTPAGVVQPFEASTRIRTFRPGAGHRICLQARHTSRRPNKECAAFFDPSLCAKETVYSWENLANLRPGVEAGGFEEEEDEDKNDVVPAAKNCRPILAGQPTILVYALGCGAARKVVRMAYRLHARSKRDSWPARPRLLLQARSHQLAPVDLPPGPQAPRGGHSQAVVRPAPVSYRVSASQAAIAQSTIACMVASEAPSRAWIERPSSTVL